MIKIENAHISICTDSCKLVNAAKFRLKFEDLIPFCFPVSTLDVCVLYLIAISWEVYGSS